MSETETAEQPPAPVVNGTPTEIAAGVHVVPDGRVPLVPNVGIVLGDERALVVDTAMGPANGGGGEGLRPPLARGPGGGAPTPPIPPPPPHCARGLRGRGRAPTH